ncbi:hypothetical protein [Bdellovibrio bacteriovorus]|uniref:hypothetical protein n=1 Tax=Bdellovibrio bacteriovorus TaxID=959 RepID=UPI0035A6AC6C
MILRSLVIASLLLAASSSASARLHRFKEGGGDQSLLFKCTDTNKSMTVLGLRDSSEKIEILIFWQDQLVHHGTGQMSEDRKTLFADGFVLDLSFLNCTRGSL